MCGPIGTASTRSAPEAAIPAACGGGRWGIQGAYEPNQRSSTEQATVGNSMAVVLTRAPTSTAPTIFGPLRAAVSSPPAELLHALATLRAAAAAAAESPCRAYHRFYFLRAPRVIRVTRRPCTHGCALPLTALSRQAWFWGGFPVLRNLRTVFGTNGVNYCYCRCHYCKIIVLFISVCGAGNAKSKRVAFNTCSRRHRGASRRRPPPPDVIIYTAAARRTVFLQPFAFAHAPRRCDNRLPNRRTGK